MRNLTLKLILTNILRVTMVDVCFLVFGNVKPVLECSNGTVNITKGFSSLENLGKNCTDKTVFNSLVVAFNLTNDLSYVPALMASVQLGGELIGSLLTGPMADLYGRRSSLILLVIWTLLLGIGSGFSPTWPVMLAFRFFLGITTGGIESVGVIYVLEHIGTQYRLPIQATIDCSNSIGFAFLAFVAYLTQDWKILSIAGNLLFLPCILALLWLEESPRWLYQVGAIDKANLVIKKIAKINGVDNITEIKEMNSKNNNLVKKTLRLPEVFMRQTYVELFRNGNIAKNTLMVMLSFGVAGIVGYGFIFNVTNLSNIYITFALQGLLNIIPTVLLAASEYFMKWGRRPVHQLSLTGVWLSLIVVTTLSALGLKDTQIVAVNAACLIGSICSFPLWVICNVYSAELFPTRVRNRANGIGGMSAKLGGMISPHLVLLLVEKWHFLPFAILAGLTVINSILAFFFLPETKGKDLPED